MVFIKQLARIILFIWSCLSLVLAIWTFEATPFAAETGYIWLAQGAVGLAILPPYKHMPRASHLWWWIMLGLCVAIGTYCTYEVYLRMDAHRQDVEVITLWPFWPLATLCMLGIAVCLDRVSGIKFPSIPAIEWITFLLFFVISCALRFIGPSTVAEDEMLYIEQGFRIALHDGVPKAPLLGDHGYPSIALVLQRLLTEVYTPFLDMITIQKGMSYVAGALSVAFLYVAIRILSNRQIAVCSSILLSFFGWHWLNSRFIYAYPLDLAAISLGLMAMALANRTKMLVFGCLAGFACASTLILQRSGGLLGPFLAYLGLEFLWRSSRQDRWRLVSIFVVAVAAFVVAYEPFAILFNLGIPITLRYQDAVRVRAEILPQLGLTPMSAILTMYVDAFKNFQIVNYDWSRHVFRPEKPILDPVFSILFSVGLAHSVIFMYRSLAARVCVVGLLIFILPMALSFPVDDVNHGLARRMLPTSLFLAWLGGIGACVIPRSLFNKERATALSYTACAVSAITNVYYYLLVFKNPTSVDWLSPGGRGIQNMAMMQVIRSVAPSKMRVIVLERYAAKASGLPETSQLRKVDRPEALREALLEKKGELQMVVVPADTQVVPRDTDLIIRSLSDLIPQYSWIPTKPHPDGTPMIWYAFVRPQ